MLVNEELPWDAVEAPPPSIAHLPLAVAKPEPPPLPPPPLPSPARAPDPPRAAPPPARELPPSAAAQRARAAYEGGAAARAPGDLPVPFDDAAEPSSAALFAATKEIDPLRLAELEALTPEIHLVSPELGDIFLVAQHSDSDRLEFTYREAAALRQMVDQFPGARVVALRRGAAPAVQPARQPEAWDA